MPSNKSLPMPIAVKPYLHQQQAFDFACMRFGLLPSDFKSNGVALLMEMGTGKTITSIGISGILYALETAIVRLWKKSMPAFWYFSRNS